MKIWYVSLYEPLPLGGENVRPMRSGLLCEAFVDAGHEVELWLPGFEHVHHAHYRRESTFEEHKEQFFIQYIKGCGYKTDTSPKRFLHNWLIAKEFNRLAKKRTQLPELIVTQIPSLELAESVVKFAMEHSVPIVVDIRDLWPDVYRRLFSRKIEFLYNVLFCAEIRRARFILKNATAITAVSASFLKWGVSKAQRPKKRSDRVFYIGYPTTDFKEIEDCEIKLLERRFDLSFKKNIVFFAGTFCSSYDLETVFKSAKMLLENQIDDVQIIIAGGGSGVEVIKNVCAKLDNVSFVGWLDAAELKLFLSVATIGLAPYAKGALMSLPNKPFEYMAASLPIVTCLKGELEALIIDEECGKFYSPGNAEELFDALMYLRNNPQIAASMGANCKEVFDDRFESSKIYSSFVNHLEGISDEARRKKIKRD